MFNNRKEERVASIQDWMMAAIPLQPSPTEALWNENANWVVNKEVHGMVKLIFWALASGKAVVCLP